MNRDTSPFWMCPYSLVGATLVVLASSLTANAALEVWINPANLTSAETFSLRAFHEFGSCCHQRLDQSISFEGNQIDVFVLMEPPYEIALPVVNKYGAYFADLGPLGPGTYHVDAEMWMRRRRFAGYEDVLFNTGSLTFEVAEPQPSVTLEGDYNSDGEVDAADYVVWRANLGSSDNLAADGDGSGMVDEPDYGIWRLHFGQTLGSAAAASATLNTVPEPVTLSLAVAGMILVLYMRKLDRRGPLRRRGALNSAKTPANKWRCIRHHRACRSEPIHPAGRQWPVPLRHSANRFRVRRATGR